MSTQAWTVQVERVSHRITLESDPESGRASIRVDGKMATRPLGPDEEEREFRVGAATYVLRRLPDGAFDLDLLPGYADPALAPPTPAAKRKKEKSLRSRLIGYAVLGVVAAMLWWAWDSTAYLRVPWKEWTSPPAAVTIDFPSEPETTTSRIGSGQDAPLLTNHEARYRRHLYVLQHYDLPEPIPEPQAPSFLTSEVQDLWKGSELEPLSETRVSNRDAIHYVAHLEADGDHPATTVRGLATLHQSRVYLAWVETPLRESETWDVDRYLHSMHLPRDYPYAGAPNLAKRVQELVRQHEQLREVSTNLRLISIFSRLAVAVVALILGIFALRSTMSR